MLNSGRIGTKQPSRRVLMKTVIALITVGVLILLLAPGLFASDQVIAIIALSVLFVLVMPKILS